MALNARVERGGVCGFFEQQLFGFRLTWFLSITGWYTCIRSFLSSFFSFTKWLGHFWPFFDQILVIFHSWIFSPERLTHFRDFEGTGNVSIFPGRLYMIYQWCGFQFSSYAFFGVLENIPMRFVNNPNLITSLNIQSDQNMMTPQMKNSH